VDPLPRKPRRDAASRREAGRRPVRLLGRTTRDEHLETNSETNTYRGGAAPASLRRPPRSFRCGQQTRPCPLLLLAQSESAPARRLRRSRPARACCPNEQRVDVRLRGAPCRTEILSAKTADLASRTRLADLSALPQLPTVSSVTGAPPPKGWHNSGRRETQAPGADTEQLLRAAEATGWRVELGKRRSHFVIYAPGGDRMVAVPSRGSDPRTLRNIRATLMRAGILRGSAERSEGVRDDARLDEPATSALTSFRAASGDLLQAVTEDPALLSQLHWRQFEELVAELLDRDGFDVELTCPAVIEASTSTRDAATPWGRSCMSSSASGSRPSAQSAPS
jgi:hypothetical protein